MAELIALGEALTLRADMQRRLSELRTRLLASAQVQEGESPAEDPEVLLDELERTAAGLQDLIARINRTNLTVTIATGESLTDAIARRDVLAIRYAVNRELAAAASARPERYSLREIKVQSTVDVGAIRRKVDAIARERRELDVALQAANWANALAD